MSRIGGETRSEEAACVSVCVGGRGLQLAGGRMSSPSVKLVSGTLCPLQPWGRLSHARAFSSSAVTTRVVGFLLPPRRQLSLPVSSPRRLPIGCLCLLSLLCQTTSSPTPARLPSWPLIDLAVLPFKDNTPEDFTKQINFSSHGCLRRLLVPEGSGISIPPR